MGFAPTTAPSVALAPGTSKDIVLLPCITDRWRHTPRGSRHPYDP